MDGAAFELGLLGAIAGGLFVARTVGANFGTCSPGQVDPTGEWKGCKQSLTLMAIALLIWPLKGIVRGYL
jgi:hypothetical protein